MYIPAKQKGSYIIYLRTASTVLCIYYMTFKTYISFGSMPECYPYHFTQTIFLKQKALTIRTVRALLFLICDLVIDQLKTNRSVSIVNDLPGCLIVIPGLT